MQINDVVGRGLLSVLRCPACHTQEWAADAVRRTLTCRACGHAHRIANGILQLHVLDEHPEVSQERASVPATEMAPELGGWKEAYTPATDPSSSLAQAYLSLPYGDDSAHFQEPGYFQNVRRFAAEFDFILQHLPRHGRLLDVGADGTWSTARLASRGLSCIALDITDHLSLARLFQTACPPYALVNVDMHEPVFVDDAFDVVTAFNALHHSRRLDALASNIARVLKPGGVFGFVEPYVQNAQQEADFGAPQTAMGINENVHTIARWHDAFSNAGLALEVYSLSDSFNAVYRKDPAKARHVPSLGGDFYDASLQVMPQSVTTRVGMPVDFAVTVTSEGRSAWASRGPEPIRLSYHLSRVTPEGSVMVSFDNDRTLLPAFVCPGQPGQFMVPVVLNERGTFDVEFDLVHEARCWFKEQGGRTSIARLTVA